jgi:diguanylate cyclase (GGDEF)-like protein
MVDIDFFKKLNDKHGHIVGDKALVLLARYLMDNLRPYDKIFRYGGEEFLICIPHSNVLEANEMIDRLRAGIAAMPFNVGLPNSIHMAVSCGIALLDPNTAIEVSIDNVDSAMYLAKSNGRNRTEIKSL